MGNPVIVRGLLQTGADLITNIRMKQKEGRGIVTVTWRGQTTHLLRHAVDMSQMRVELLLLLTPNFFLFFIFCFSNRMVIRGYRNWVVML